MVAESDTKREYESNQNHFLGTENHEGNKGFSLPSFPSVKCELL